ncbi:DUF397 domain-containing protein [Streptomyces chryseus]|uniref:DUF397 domain-containing protein n=1 Tax=Streptomyces chryseus TaxID=68186 RepID=A0ABQ3DMV3_9ACTN|nr:DUF397 domain-containing protein [Streptomyces chryseus]GGX03881.1 hypothetical protein GCM10010353_19270 [Streptomyces chryseus]GHB07261.1 hypothetical protein GCM10010346_33150 [Streptomyces chryseus]
MTLKPSGSASALEWTKSSYSTNDGPNCVEVATGCGTVHVRDSKSVHGPQLGFAPGSWADFLAYASTR